MNRIWIAQRRKAILSALGTAVLAIVGAATEGMTGAEFAMAVTAALTTAVVYIVSNAPLDAPTSSGLEVYDPQG